MLWGIHNYDLAPKLSRDLLAGRLKAEEKQKSYQHDKELGGA